MYEQDIALSWIRLSLFGTYWYIRLKVIMIVVRDQETQLVEKEGEFEEFGHLFLSCWMQVLMSGGITYRLIGCSRHLHRP